MIPFTHPLVQDYLRAAREHPHDETLVMILLWDRLQDDPDNSGGGFPPPGQPGGLDLPTLCWWYARGRDEDEPALWTALAVVDEMTPVPLDVLLRVPSRPDRVRAMREDVQLFVRLVLQDEGVQRELRSCFGQAIGEYILRGQEVALPRLLGDHPAVQAAEKRAKAAVCRDLRRRVLAMYPEVEVTVRCEVSQYQYACLPTPMDEPVVALFRDNCFRLDLDTRAKMYRRAIIRTEDRENRRWVYTQTLAASDLIPPEPGIIDAR